MAADHFAAALLAPVTSLARTLVERRLGGYRRAVHAEDRTRPLRAPVRRTAAVIGGGIAGMTAAATLAERGFAVTLFERNRYLGGKIGSWTEHLPGGETFRVDHGFHAFFRSYYNLRALLERAGVARHLRPVEDYTIVARDGHRVGFRGVSTTPVLNLLELSRKGLYRKRDLVLNRSLHKLELFLRYDPEQTFAAYDDVSFEQFARDAALPRELRLVFNSFARAFFAQPAQMSLAEMAKGFHFYYLSNDGGLLYDYLADDHERAFNGPLREHLERLGVRVLLGRGVDALAREGGRFLVQGERFDYAVLASDADSTRRLAERSGALLAPHGDFAARLARLRASNRYAVLRVWLDREVAGDLPVFAVTDGPRVLDSLTSVHRIAGESRAWAEAHGGGVYELHCYSVPDDVPDDASVRRLLLKELELFFPAARGARVVHEHLQVRSDFTAFFVGMHRDRPETETPIEALYLAGDWVKLPHPAMLMEAACMSGLLAANAALRREGLREAPVYSVPARGVLAGAPALAGG